MGQTSSNPQTEFTRLHDLILAEQNRMEELHENFNWNRDGLSSDLMLNYNIYSVRLQELQSLVQHLRSMHEAYELKTLTKLGRRIASMIKGPRKSLKEVNSDYAALTQLTSQLGIGPSEIERPFFAYHEEYFCDSHGGPLVLQIDSLDAVYNSLEYDAWLQLCKVDSIDKYVDFEELGENDQQVRKFMKLHPMRDRPFMCIEVIGAREDSFGEIQNYLEAGAISEPLKVPFSFMRLLYIDERQGGGISQTIYCSRSINFHFEGDESLVGEFSSKFSYKHSKETFFRTRTIVAQWNSLDETETSFQLVTKP